MSDGDGDPIWLTEQDVVGLVDMTDAVDALRSGFAEHGRGEVLNMTKAHSVWPGATLHAIGAVAPSAGGLACVKAWAHTPNGATPLLLLIRVDDGSIATVIEAFALGQLRTGALSGVATDLLARPDASSLAILGTGKQALAQVAAVAAIRTLEDVRVWSPTQASRDRFVNVVGAELGLCARACALPSEAVDGADVVTTATRAREPFLTAALPRNGAHLNAIGAITPERIEFEPSLLARCAIVAADSPAQARELSSEFVQHFGATDTWDALVSLGDIAAAGTGRPPGADLTLFKAMGVGVSDLALAREVYRRARASGLGRPFAHPRRAKPRLAPRQSVQENVA